jgi:serpin B
LLPIVEAFRRESAGKAPGTACAVRFGTPMEKRVGLPLAVAAFLAFVGCSGVTNAPGDAPSSLDASSSIADAGPPAELAQVDAARVPGASIPQASLNAAVAANNAFTVDLYSRLARDSAATNVLTSPMSASLALTMTYAGAEGQTATEMATALHFGIAGGKVIFDGQNALSQSLATRGPAALAAAAGSSDTSPDDYKLQVVNSVWGQKTLPWATPFLTTVATSYGAGVYLEDFIDQPEQARQAINTWVSAQTNNQINNLLPIGEITADMRVVLVDAIDLKMPWANPFDPETTAPGTFTRADGTTVSPSFMGQMQSELLPYVDDVQAQVVALPLSIGGLAVVIALPHPGVDLGTYEASLASGSAALAQPQSSSWVKLRVPKLTFTSDSVTLVPALKAMGMVRAFDPNQADFSGMCPSGLFLFDVLQKATISMQESGVSAAAATAVLGGESAALPPGVSMVVNRPYLVAIVDVPTGAILFLGHVADPTDSGKP